MLKLKLFSYYHNDLSINIILLVVVTLFAGRSTGQGFPPPYLPDNFNYCSNTPTIHNSEFYESGLLGTWELAKYVGWNFGWPEVTRDCSTVTFHNRTSTWVDWKHPRSQNLTISQPYFNDTFISRDKEIVQFNSDMGRSRWAIEGAGIFPTISGPTYSSALTFMGFTKAPFPLVYESLLFSSCGGNPACDDGNAWCTTVKEIGIIIRQGVPPDFNELALAYDPILSLYGLPSVAQLPTILHDNCTASTLQL